MIFNDAAHNRQSQPGATFLGGKIRQEKSFFQFRGHPVAGVSDADLDRVALADQSGGDLYLAEQRILHGLSSIVHQIGQAPASSLQHQPAPAADLQPDSAHPNAFQPAVEHGQSVLARWIDVSGLRLGRPENEPARKTHPPACEQFRPSCAMVSAQLREFPSEAASGGLHGQDGGVCVRRREQSGSADS